jgi:hypothetical protein
VAGEMPHRGEAARCVLACGAVGGLAGAGGAHRCLP